ncbi:maleylpyruvate isomerase family mycothiol-dependent enzyme [Actinomycetospora endophytica]|uniref:Maleylpyruvate isomerase family mycothiol-dependent enzyme n=1 Tax=Actinomycetospora endophytica TaxID=2291215 RepID=A0ABS8PBQ6_9PSEU|nr:maleylpyruvate isomerase family mycothiol-dependent enzyme [Actinomycetospora endophytica]MCD2195433.1 maleylpyruvate isomerase family mycothiol-dependent enzyme [Actinomycetospora endophytica]
MSAREDDPVVTRVGELRPLERPETVELARAETSRMVALLRDLRPPEWGLGTDCSEWDVRALAGHVLGMTETFTGLPVMARTMIGAGRAQQRGTTFIDTLTARQVRANASLTTGELISRMGAAGPSQARWRGSRRLLRRMPLPNELHDGTTETWRFAFLLDVILTRDTWMHRVDVATATGRPLELTSDHDGRIVADVVAEWARRHGQPFRLHLTGPAGGEFTHGDDGPELTLDAVGFCRTLAGRLPGEGLLAQEVPF